jgi:hypothetical protein
MSYSPPSSPLNFTFVDGGYSPLSSPLTLAFVVATTQEVYPQSLGETGAVGEPLDVRNRNQFVEPQGVEGTVSYGTANVYNLRQFVEAQGFITSDVGAAIARWTQYVDIDGFVTSEVFAPSAASYPVRLVFNVPREPQAPPLVFNFAFGDGLGVIAQGIAGQVGSADVSNTSLDIRPAGLDSPVVGDPGASNASLDIRPSGFIATTIGAGAAYAQQRVNAAGFVAQQFGTASVVNFLQYVQPAGLLAQAFGSAEAYNFNKEVFVNGLDGFASADGHEVFNYRGIITASGFTSGAVSAPLSVDFWLRRVRPVNIDSAEVGAHLAQLKNRSVQPPSFVATEIGSASVSYLNRSITAPGVEVWSVPPPAVFDPRQFVRPLGFGAAFGTASLRNRNQTFRAPHVFDLEFGSHLVRNKNQEVYLPPAVDFEPADFGQVSIRNRNIEVFPDTIAPTQLRGRHEVYLDDIAVHATAGDLGAVGEPWVSNFNRSLLAEGFDSARPPLWFNTSVRNTAGVARPPGFDAEAFGAHVVTLPKIVKPAVTVFDRYGTPYVSLSPITVAPPGQRTASVSMSARASVSPQRVLASWDVPDAIGAVLLEIRRNIVGVQSFRSATFGSTAVANRNRQVRPFTIIGEYGAPRVANRNQFVSPQGYVDERVGLHWVRDRTSYVRPFSVRGSFGNALLQKFPPDPPGLQAVYPASITAELPRPPTIFDSTVRPPGQNFARFGTPEARTNTILVRGIFEDFVSLTRHSIPIARVVSVPSLLAQDTYGFHGASPLTVWATSTAPGQAINNHGGKRWEPVDFQLQVGVGRPTVSNRNRVVFVSPQGPTTAFGTPFASTRPQRLLTTGFRSDRIGVPSIPNPGAIELLSGIDATEFGVAVVGPYVAPNTTQTVRPAATNGQFGTAWVANFTRYINASGFTNPSFGDPWVSTAPIYTPAEGFDTLATGLTFIAYRVRELPVEGFDSFTDGPTLGEFVKRMRVTSRARSGVTGVTSTAFGQPSVGSAVRSILPDAVAPPPIIPPRIQHKANVAGLQSAIFGAPSV